MPKKLSRSRQLYQKRRNLYKRYKKCFYCKCKLTFKTSTLDHKIPTSRGGDDSYKNLVLSCKKCNNEKGNRTVEEWLSSK